MDATATKAHETHETVEEIRRAEDLPDDLGVLKQLVMGLLALNANLRKQLEYLLRRRYGPQSERSDPAQLDLFTKQILALLGRADEAVESEKETPECNGHEQAVPRRRRRGGRRRIPAHLPRIERTYELSASELPCEVCGQMRCVIGAKVNEEIEYEPPKLHVIRHVCLTYACPSKCPGEVVTAPKPTGAIPKGLAGPGLLAHVILSKIDDHLPLYRQEEILKRNGIDLPRSTLCDWMLGSATTLEPLVKLMKSRVLESKVIQTDGTSIPLLVRGKTKTESSGFWVYVGDERNPYTVYDFTPTQSRAGPEKWLRGFSGVLQADASKIYDPFYDVKTFGTQVWEAGCFAHARRYFDKAKMDQPGEALAALAWIARLYEVEERAKGMSPRRRRKVRRRESKRILRGFRAWLEETKKRVLPKSPVGEAIEYTLTHWKALTRFVDHGRVSIDNNASERAIRPLKIGVKNWLFAGSAAGAKATAILFSMVESAKRCGVDAWAYLADTLARINDLPQSRLPELLPDEWHRRRSCRGP